MTTFEMEGKQVRSKMKLCNVCGKLSSDSAKKCHSCGSTDLVKGVYEKFGPEEDFEEDRPKNDNKDYGTCPIDNVPLTKDGKCPYCDLDLD